MEYLIVPVDKLEGIDTELNYRRKSNDGTKAIIHKELFDKLVPQIATMDLSYDEEGNPIEQERTYPFPLVTGEEINQMEEFKSIEPDIK